MPEPDHVQALREMGARSEWRHNRSGVFRKLFYLLLVIALFALAISAIATDGFEDFR